MDEAKAIFDSELQSRLSAFDNVELPYRSKRSEVAEKHLPTFMRKSLYAPSNRWKTSRLAEEKLTSSYDPHEKFFKAYDETPPCSPKPHKDILFSTSANFYSEFYTFSTRRGVRPRNVIVDDKDFSWIFASRGQMYIDLKHIESLEYDCKERFDSIGADHMKIFHRWWKKEFFKYVENLESSFSTIVHSVRDATTARSLFRIFSHFGVFLYQISRAESYSDYSAAVYQFLGTQVDVGGFISRFLSSSLSVLKTIKTTIVSQSSSAQVHGFFDMIFSSRVYVVLRDLISSAISLRFFSKNMADKFSNVFGRPKRVTLSSFFRQILDGLCLFFDACSACARGQNFYKVLRGDKPDLAAMTELRRLVSLHPYVAYNPSGDPEAIDCFQFVGECDQILAASRELYTHMSSKDPSKDIIQKLILELSALRSSVDAKIKSRARSAPCNFIVSGFPGVGKTAVQNRLFATWSAARGRIHNENMIFVKTTGSKYWEGYIPSQQPYLKLSEMGSQSIGLADKERDADFIDILGVCSADPKPLDMAFGEKGSVSALFELVILDTNNPGLHVEKQFYSPGAVMRRFKRIDVTILPEYRKTDGTEISRRKVQDAIANGDIPDLFAIYRFDVIDLVADRNKYVEQVIHSGVTFDVIDDFVIQCARNYEEEQRHSHDVREALAHLRDEHVEVKAQSASLVIQNPSVTLWILRFVVGCAFSYFVGKNRSFSRKTFSVGCGAAVLWYVGLLPLFTVVTSTMFAFDFFNTQAWQSPDVYVATRVHDSFVALPYIAYLIGIRRRIPSLWNEYQYTIVAAFAAFLSASIGAVWLYRRHPKVAHQVAIQDIEKSLGSQLPRERVKVKNRDAVWNSVSRDLEPAAHKDTPRSTHSFVSKNIWIASRSDGVKNHVVHALGVRGNILLINRHFFPKTFKVITVGLSDGQTKVTCEVLFKDMLDIGPDLCLFVFAKRQFKDIVMHFPSSENLPTSMVSFFRDSDTVTLSGKSVTFVTPNGGEVKISNGLSTRAPNGIGLCGYPVIARVNSGSQIIGIHAGGREDEDICYGIPVTRKLLEDGVDYLRKNGTFSPVTSQAAVVSTELPVPKSLFNYEHLPGVEYFGRLPGSIMVNNKSRLVDQGFTDDLAVIFFKHFGHIRSTRYGAPVMKPMMKNGTYISPWNYGMRKIGVVKPPVSLSICSTVVEKCTAHLCKTLEANSVSLSPYDLNVAVNGYVHDQYMRPMNKSTSAGYGLAGLKRDYLEEVKCEDTVRFYPNAELTRLITDSLEAYMKGESVLHIVQACLKDEPRDLEKVKIGKTRIFYIEAFVKVIIGRMLLAPFYTLMHQFPDLFGTAIGIDMHRRSGDLYHRLSKFDRGLAGDYSNYDQRMPEEIGLAVNTIIVRVCAKFGYNDSAQVALQGLLSDNLFPIISVLQDVMCAPGLQISGKYGTAEDNSLRGLVLLMYAWEDMGLGEFDFFDHVIPVTYGDDLQATVDPVFLPRFNNFTYRTVVESMGMAYTSPDKDTPLMESYALEDMDFLKRSKFFWEEKGQWVAPLSLDSLFKILEWNIPSQVDTPYEQMKSATDSLLREAYFHLRDSSLFFEFRSDIIALLTSKFGEIVGYSSFPTYDDIDMSLFPVPSQSSVSSEKFVRCECPVSSDYDVLILFFRTEHVRASQWLEDNKVQEDEYQSVTGEARKVVIYMYDCAKTVSFLREAVETPRNFMLRVMSQSAQLGMDNLVSASTTLVDENVSDMAGYEEKTVGVSAVNADRQGQTNILTNLTFFERPIIIASFQLFLNAAFDGSYDVWDLWSSDPRVRAKLSNWSYFKGNLHVRVSISGVPQHYGSMLLSYQPYPGRNDTLQNLLTGLGNFSFRPLIMNYLSQAKGAVMMGISENSPVEYVIPFISPKPSFRLFNEAGTVITSLDSYEDMQEAGTLFFFSQNDPKSASSAPTNPTVVITAWVTDVDLGVPTATRIEVPSQSATEDMKGPVERITSKAADISSALASVPSLKPFATATSTLFRGMAGISSLFGWSYPIVEEKNDRFRPNPFANGANSIGCSTAKKITLDPKQELGMVAPFFGYDNDELSIVEISSRPSLLTKFTWSPLDVYEDVLWRSKVTPYLATYYSDPSGRWFMPSAMCFAATPYSHWRGTLTFTFDIVISKFHSGKLYVRYEPNIAQSALIGLNMNWNTNFVQVVDIQNTRRISMDIQWAAPRAWQRMGGDEETMYGSLFNAAASEFINGYIEVGVYNGLQSPVTDDVEINVLVSCKDLKVSCLSDEYMPSDRTVPFQSFVTDVESVVLAKTSAVDEKVGYTNFGETCLSFRSALKRYSLTKRHDVPADASAGPKWFQYIGPVIPGPVPVYGSTIPVPSERPNVFGYLRYAYLGVRGGIRKRFRPSFSYTPNTFQRAVTSLTTPSGSTSTFLGFNGGCADMRMNGSVGEILQVNSNIEVEIPFYTPNYMFFSCAEDLLGPTPVNELVTEWYSGIQLAIDFVDATGAGFLLEESSVGEDFNFLVYLGPPFYRRPL